LARKSTVSICLQLLDSLHLWSKHQNGIDIAQRLQPLPHFEEKAVREGIPMDCPKCKGLMISERMTDYSIVFYGWRCINCGTIMDGIIMKNKEKPAAAYGKVYAEKLRKVG
jgi:ssDNA-binding Zn-finger/Zn-ribbon topoisomerase 1